MNKIEKTLKISSVGGIVTLVLSLAITAFFNVYFPQENILLQILMSIITTIVSVRFLSFIIYLYILKSVYSGNTEEYKTDMDILIQSVGNPNLEKMEKPENTVTQIGVKIVNLPKSPIGRFMDVDFYDWMEIERSGERIKLVFSGTTLAKNLGNAVIENDSYIFPPGLIYVREQN